MFYIDDLEARVRRGEYLSTTTMLQLIREIRHGNDVNMRLRYSLSCTTRALKQYASREHWQQIGFASRAWIFTSEKPHPADLAAEALKESDWNED